MARPRRNIVLVKRATPKCVHLWDGRTFYAKHKRVDRDALSHNLTTNRTYRGRPVRGRQARVRRQVKLAHQVTGRKHIGGTYWSCILANIFFYLIVLDLLVLRNL